MTSPRLASFRALALAATENVTNDGYRLRAPSGEVIVEYKHSSHGNAENDAASAAVMEADDALTVARGTLRTRFDALLDGAPADVVQGDVVRRAMPGVVAAWLRRHDALASVALLAVEAEKEGAAVIGEMVEAALAAAKGTP